VGNSPTLATTELLAPIWQRVLQRPFVRADDNFFDLGGDPSSAVQLFGEIAKTFGRELPPLTIYQTPTLAALTALLEGATLPPFPTLIPLREGTGDRAVFITHGLGGSVMEIFHVAKGLPSRHPVYGLQSQGFDGKVEPLARIEDMAEVSLEAIRCAQPRGPYALVGYSFGGLVMMEVAQRLHEKGESVALLAMLETFPHQKYLPLKMRLGLRAGHLKRHASIVNQLPLRKKVAYLTKRSERRLRVLFDNHDQSEASRPPESGLLSGSALERVRDAQSLALARYRPRFYPGKINFLKAAVNIALFPDDPQAIWARLAEKFEIDTVPGDHFGIVTTQYQRVSAVLSRHLAAAFSGA
jgi:acetoacetyl-CoA synthetase